MRDAPILVTGGAGFIGSALVRHLVLERGLPVVTVDALTTACHLSSLGEAAASPLHAFERADIANAAQVEAVLRRHQPRAIMHLAAESHVDRSIDGPAAFVHTNVVGTFTLLEQATRYWHTAPPTRRRGFRFLHVSTDEGLGTLDEPGRVTFGSSSRPSAPYAASKAASDHFACAWHRTYGLPVTITNGSNNYGPYQDPGTLIPFALRRALAGAPIPIHGSGRQVRDWLHVEDHVRGLVAALERGAVGRTYRFGGGAERTTLDVVRAVCDAVDATAPAGAPRRALITHVSGRPEDEPRCAIELSHTAEALGWSAQWTFEEGLRETVAWYVANPSWVTDCLGGRDDVHAQRLATRGVARVA